MKRNRLQRRGLAVAALVAAIAIGPAAASSALVLGFEPNVPDPLGCCKVAAYNASAANTDTHPTYIVQNADGSAADGSSLEDSVWGEVVQAGQLQSLNSDHQFVLSVPLTVGVGFGATQAQIAVGLQDVVNGDWDGQYSRMAQELRDAATGDTHSNAGYPNAVIRLGYEFDGGWMPWSANGNEALWVQAYQHVWGLLHAVSSGFTFDWNGDPGYMQSETAAYPGDAYVDTIGLDVYDQGAGAAWNSTTNTWVDPVASFNVIKANLQWTENFAVTHGKTVSYPEWALSGHKPGQTDQNGGDDPTFIQGMYDWMSRLPTSGAGSLAYDSYFDQSPDQNHQISTGIFPKSLARFRTLFGSRTAVYGKSILAQNPLGYWRLDESSGTTAADSSGNAHDSTYTGGYTLGAASALVTDSDRALTLNGTTGYVNAGSLGVTQSSAFTEEVWVKSTSAANAWLVSEGSTSSATPAAGLSTNTSGSKARFSIRDDAGTTVGVTGTATVNDGVWHHIVGVRNGTSLSLYVDGKLDGTTTGTLGTITLNTTTIAAIRQPTTGGYLNGSIDEAAMYTTALGASQVVNQYQSSKSIYAGSLTSTAPAAYWRLGETSGTAANDVSGNAHSGTYTGGYTLGAVDALASDTNKAVTLNGTTGYVSAGNLGVTQSPAFTEEVWVKTTSAANAWLISEGSTSSATPAAGLSTNTSGSKARFSIRDSASTTVGITGASTINDGQWHDLVGVRDGTSLSLYVDGVLDGTTTGTVGSISLNTTTIGAIRQPTTGGYLNGSLDEAAMYTSALSASEVESQYDAAASIYAGLALTSSPSAYWRLGESSGTAAADASSSGATGSYTGGYTFGATGAIAADANNKAVTLNGSTGYVNAGYQGVTQSSAFTEEVWVKTTSTANAWLFSEGSTSSLTPAGGLSTNTSGSKARFSIRDDANATVGVTGTTTINDGQWHHLVGVRNGTSLSLYVDGQLDGTTTGTVGTITLNTTSIGAIRQPTTGAYLNGSIDEAAIYLTALDAGTIAQHYYFGTR